MARSWTPAWRITANGRDITAALADRLLSLKCSDAAEDKSNRLTLSLDDRPRPDGLVLDWPPVGARLGLALGYREAGLVTMGDYRIDEIRYTSPPATLEVRARAAGLEGAIRTRVCRSWDRQTLGGIAAAIAAEHDLEPRIAADLAEVPVAHADQAGESAIAFLGRLAARVDASARPLGPYLVVARRGEAVAVTGASLPAVRLRPDRVSRWSFTHAARRESGASGEAQGGIRTRWWDGDAGEERVIEVGQPPFEETGWVHHSEAEARAAAAGSRNAGERNPYELTLSLPGDPAIQAEARLTLEGWRPGIPADWRITSVDHAIGNQGYVTRLTAERHIAGQADAPRAATTSPVHPDDALD